MRVKQAGGQGEGREVGFSVKLLHPTSINRHSHTVLTSPKQHCMRLNVEGSVSVIACVNGVCTCVCVYVCIHVCTCVCVYVCMYVCICMYV